MAADISVAANAIRTTTTATKTVGNVVSQPFEADTEQAEAPVDLGDQRAVSLRLAWQGTQDQALTCATLYITLEASDDSANGPWTPCAEQFQRVHYGRTPLGSQVIGLVAPARYLRARWQIPAAGPRKLEAQFSITGRAT
jgi:hypothetical protein